MPFPGNLFKIIGQLAGIYYLNKKGMRPIVYCILAILPLNLKSQTHTTVAAGNFSDIAIWDCECPPLPGDSLVIRHNIILDEDLTFSGYLYIDSTGILRDVFGAEKIFSLNGGSLINHGAFLIGNVNYTSGTLLNYGVLNANKRLEIGSTAQLYNYASIASFDSLIVGPGAGLFSHGHVSAQHLLLEGNMHLTGAFHGEDGDAHISETGYLYNHDTLIDLMFRVGNLYNTGVIVNDQYIWINQVFANSGEVTNNRFVLSHGVLNGDNTGGTALFLNNGRLSNYDMDFGNGDSIGGSAVFINHGYVQNGYDGLNTNVWNHQAAGGSAILTTDSLFYVYGNLDNSGTLNDNGSVYIQFESSNSGVVNGPGFFCDETGFDFDTNTGTIDSALVFCTNGWVSVGEQEVSALVRVYPNPVSRLLNLETQSGNLLQLKLFNTTGQEMISYTLKGNHNTIDVSGFPSGLYLYQVSGDDCNISGTLYKE